jgi:hypothetical protein
MGVPNVRPRCGSNLYWICLGGAALGAIPPHRRINQSAKWGLTAGVQTRVGESSRRVLRLYSIKRQPKHRVGNSVIFCRLKSLPETLKSVLTICAQFPKLDVAGSSSVFDDQGRSCDLHARNSAGHALSGVRNETMSTAIRPVLTSINCQSLLTLGTSLSVH